MKCSDIIAKLEQAAPPSFAESWDNVGLLCGRTDKEVHTVYIALDATEEVIDAAVAAGADLLLTHHPLIFKGIKQVRGDDFIGKRILKLAEHRIAYYAMHTNFDVMGMADAVADQLHLRDRSVLSVTYEDSLSKEGIGRVGALPRPMTLVECADYVKNVCKVDRVKVFGEPTADVVMAAVCPGSGKGSVEDAVAAGADVLITGDIGHHEGLDALEQGLFIIDAGHYGLEKVFVPYMEETLRRSFPGLKVITAPVASPFWIL